MAIALLQTYDVGSVISSAVRKVAVQRLKSKNRLATWYRKTRNVWAHERPVLLSKECEMFKQI